MITILFTMNLLFGAVLVVLAIITAKLHNINETLKQIECSLRGRP